MHCVSAAQDDQQRGSYEILRGLLAVDSLMFYITYFRNVVNTSMQTKLELMFNNKFEKIIK